MNYVAQFKLKLTTRGGIINERILHWIFILWMPSENDYIKFVSDSEYAEAYREEQENE